MDSSISSKAQDKEMSSCARAIVTSTGDIMQTVMPRSLTLKAQSYLHRWPFTQMKTRLYLLRLLINIGSAVAFLF